MWQPAEEPSQGASNQGLHTRPACKDLPGDPSLPFHVRCNLAAASRSHLPDLVIVAITLLTVFKARHILDPALHAWSLVFLAACAAQMAWHATCSRPPLPSDSYVRWREALVALLRTIDLGLGLAGRMHGRTLAALPQPGSAGGVLGLCVSLPRLLYASASIAFPLMLMAWPVRLSLSCFAQAVAVLSLRRSFRGMCEGHLAHPSVQRDIHTTAQLLRMATLLPPQQVPPADPVAECDTVLSWLLVCLGLLAPLLLQAAAAGRTFHRHQQQRSEQGLPLERGRQARVYSALRSCLGGAEGYAAPAMGGALFALCAFAWDLCALHCQRTLHSSLLPEA